MGNKINRHFQDLYIFDYMRFTPFLIVVMAIAVFGCRHQGSGSEMLDLEPYGVPMRIPAPDSTMVTVKEYPFMRNINIIRDDHFHIEIFELESNRNDPKAEITRQLNAIQKSPKFLKVLQEYENGFIYSKQLDSTTVDYDFRFVEYLGEKQLIYQSAVMTSFALEDIEKMVAAIRTRELY